jgi:hypothetical protein
MGTAALASLPFKIGFDQLASCLRLLKAFVRWTEGRDASMAHAWSAGLSIFQVFAGLSQQGNGDAARCSQAFYRRLTDTADLSQLILSYLVTREGVLWY